VGLVVGQIAAINGCYVVGIAGTTKKLKQLKAEELVLMPLITIQPPTLKAIATACPKGVFILDNVARTSGCSY
jgi:NADPH-dependent curcumin reductase CurA